VVAQTVECYCCKKKRLAENVKLRRMGKNKKEYWICDDCWEELKLTTKIMEMTVDKWVETMPERYERSSQISVRCLQ